MKRRAALQSALALSGAALGCAEPGAPPGRLLVPFWFTYGGRNRATLEALVTRFNASQSDVWVRAIFQGDYFEGLAKLRTALAASAAPPLSHVIGEVVPYLAEAGVLEPLDDYPGARSLPLHPALNQAGSFLGGAKRPLVVVPFNRSTPIAYVNRRLYDGPAPQTWAELEAFAKSHTRPGRFGFGCPIDWWYWAALVGQAGGDVVEPNGNVTLGGEAGVAAVQLWQRLVASGTMKQPPGRDYNAWEQLSQDFLAERVAMIWSSTAFVRYLEETAEFPVRTLPLPHGVRGAVPTGGTHFVLLKSAPTELKQGAWRFVRFLLEPEAATFWAKETGYLPVTTEAAALLQNGFYRDHPNYQVALDQLAVARPWPWSKGLFRIQREVIQPRLESAVLERRDARRVLDEARALARESAL
ncbi:MAG: transporter substrate-binding protein [Polyangiaceae bacterium]|jgi:sn-glycerol 3-phosphate transport system substrate-binding protein|nr:transporter substrate-binding protein [Polyangiaceae bacterium]